LFARNLAVNWLGLSSLDKCERGWKSCNDNHPGKCRTARELIDMSQADLAMMLPVSRTTIMSFENGQHSNNLDAIRRALEAAGTQFNPDGVDVKLRKDGR
jgi:DNA-binding XRE family transcriptional regulator